MERLTESREHKRGDKTMNFTYTVRYINKEHKQAIMEFDTKAKAVAKAKYIVNLFGYNVAVCKELMGACVEMKIYWAK